MLEECKSLSKKSQNDEEEYIIEGDPNAKYGPPPPGLEYMVRMDSFFINDENEPVEVLNSLSCKSRYSVMDGAGQRIYYVAENFTEPGLCNYMMKQYRPFDIKVVDASGNVVLTFVRQKTAGLYCCPYCYGNTVEVKAATVGEVLGSVDVACACGQRPTLDVLNPAGEVVFKVVQAKCEPRATPIFEIWKPNDKETSIGQMTKFVDLDKAKFPEEEYVGSKFPADMNPRNKALLLGATFLLHFNRFQKI